MRAQASRLTSLLKRRASAPSLGSAEEPVRPERFQEAARLIAGANAVQIGTANFVDPFIWTKLLDGIRDYGQRHNIARLSDLVGTVNTSQG